MRRMMCKDEARVKLDFARHLEAVFRKREGVKVTLAAISDDPFEAGVILQRNRQSGQLIVHGRLKHTLPRRAPS